ncbi:MAG: Asp23/Gls24 family envelope stress response protein [Firmicutes bacterium]|nr:Asp23/Gls24 family envelope stress response protein [Bacillota bacterium]
MEVVALVGESGTGKSHKAIIIAKEKNIECIIDDGLFIKGTKVIAGKSAKREKSIVSAVKRALFMDNDHKMGVIKAIEEVKPKKILILGTSDRMVVKIAKALNLPEISKKIYIEDISNKEDIKIAKKYRNREGKHVIPVPTFEIKKDFSGYFIDKLKVLTGKKNNPQQIYEKTVVRPTFSYLGKYTISHSVIRELTKYACEKMDSLLKASNIYIVAKEEGIIINLDITIKYGIKIVPFVKKMQKNIIEEIERMTSLNIIAVNVFVKKMKKI